MGLERLMSYEPAAGERAGMARGAALMRQRAPQDRAEMVLVRADGSREAVEVSAAAGAIIADVLEKAASLSGVALLAEDAELSPEDAATILGVSRPLVRRRMDAGDLPFRRVGAHRRVRLADVLALRRREASARAALEALRADTDELMTTHGL